MGICGFCNGENHRVRSEFCSRTCDKGAKYEKYKLLCLCVNCGENNTSDFYTCAKCRTKRKSHDDSCKEQRQNYQKQKRQDARQNGFCIICCKVRPKENRLVCDVCNERAKQTAKRFTDSPHYPQQLLLRNAKARAKKFNLPFNLTINDIVIPKECPILGITLVPGKGKPLPSSPSLDRIIPALGYVPGNVCVISYKANSIKSNLTKDMLIKLTEYVSKER